MPCYSPLTAYRSKTPTRNGKQGIVFGIIGSTGEKLQVPCGQCIGCREKRTREWSARIMHESELHAENCFITLTYDPAHLPTDGSLDHTHFQKFLKRLRKRLVGKKIRYFMCGEYGEKYSRPHYHAIIFGWDPHDKELFFTRQGVDCFTSDTLTRLWGKGHCTVGDVTVESAGYTARYCLKKLTGKALDKMDEATGLKPYEVVDFYGEINTIKPEYARMSLKNGIGYEWFQKYHADVFPHDEVIVKTKQGKFRRMLPPRYYGNIFELTEPELYADIKNQRQMAVEAQKRNLTPERLAARLEYKQAQMSRLPRKLENPQ